MKSPPSWRLLTGLAALVCLWFLVMVLYVYKLPSGDVTTPRHVTLNPNHGISHNRKTFRKRNEAWSNSSTNADAALSGIKRGTGMRTQKSPAMSPNLTWSAEKTHRKKTKSRRRNVGKKPRRKGARRSKSQTTEPQTSAHSNPALADTFHSRGALTRDELLDLKNGFARHSFNVSASETVSLTRDYPDYRPLRLVYQYICTYRTLLLTSENRMLVRLSLGVVEKIKYCLGMNKLCS